MSPEDELVIDLCRAVGGLSGSPPLNVEGIHWASVAKTAAKHSVSALVFDALLKQGLPQAATEELGRRSREQFIEAALMKTATRAALDKLIEVLSEARIEHVLMKGFALDFDGDRQFRDIDMLVPEKDLQRALLALQKLGYEYVGDQINPHVRPKERGDINRQLTWNNQYQVWDEEHQVLIELHTNLFERKRTHCLDLNALLDQIELFWRGRQWSEDLRCCVFSAEHQLISMSLYAGIKYSPSIDNFKLGALVDLDRITRRGIDWNRVLDDTRRLRIAPFVLYALVMTQRLLGTPIPEEVLGELNACQSSKQRRASGWHLRCFESLQRNSLYWSKLYCATCPFLLGSRWADRVKWILLIPVLFPPRWRMASFFNIDQDSPLIYLTYLANPIRWALLVSRRLTSVDGARVI